MKLILEAIKVLFRRLECKFEGITKSNSSAIEKVSERLSDVSNTASNALRTAASAKTAADNAKTAADNADTMAKDAQDTASSALSVAYSKVGKYERTISEYIDDNIFDLQIGEKVVVSKSGQFHTTGAFITGNIVCLQCTIRRQVGESISFRNINAHLIASDGYHASGFVFLDTFDFDSRLGFTVDYCNVVTTSTLTFTRIA